MKIKIAAIMENGEVFTGRRHSDIIFEISQKTGKRVNGVQGFVTDTGQFVGREEAAKIAFEAGQIKKEQPRLFSEDLY